MPYACAVSDLGQFGAYRLLRPLGRGGMAETFVALRKGEGGVEQKVCVKRILPAFARDDAFLELFLEEARLSARLHHGVIAQVLDFGVADEAYFLTLELVEGADLRGLLRHLRDQGRVFPTRLAFHLAFQLASALEYAHAADETGRPRGIVHRDLSPSNVLVSAEGEIKLTDFGIAKAMGADVATRTAAVKGKIPYMPPEYAEAGRFDARGDIFALGVTLFEALGGRRPYHGRDDLDTLRCAREGMHPPLEELRPDVPAAFAQLIEQMIRPEPQARPRHAAALLDALLSVEPMISNAEAPDDVALGELVREVQSAASRGSEETDPHAATVLRDTRARDGTLALDAEGLAPMSSPTPADASSPTRTRWPRPPNAGDPAASAEEE